MLQFFNLQWAGYNVSPLPALSIEESAMNFTSNARVALLALITLIGTTSLASADSGIKFGPTFPKFSTDTLEFDGRTGWEAGLFFGGKRSGVLGLQGEINWIRKNGQQGVQGQDFRIDYLQLPALLRLNIGSSSASGFDIYGIIGPSVEVKIGDEIEGVTIDDGFENADISLIMGGGIEVARIIVEGRYTNGFRRINNLFSAPTEIKSRSFTLLFGFRFN
jgi:hypothetical protein